MIHFFVCFFGNILPNIYYRKNWKYFWKNMKKKQNTQKGNHYLQQKKIRNFFFLLLTHIARFFFRKKYRLFCQSAVDLRPVGHLVKHEVLKTCSKYFQVFFFMTKKKNAWCASAGAQLFRWGTISGKYCFWRKNCGYKTIAPELQCKNSLGAHF